MSYKLEQPDGAVDGANRIFVTSHEYLPGSVRVVVRGIARQEHAPDGWTELGARRVQLRTPPKAGDEVLIFYEAA